MANNNTYTVLANDVITNGTYSIRYVMENDAPRFALCDFFKTLGYKCGILPNYYKKKFDLGQIVGSDNILRHYVTKEQAEEIFRHLRKMTPEFLSFWNDVVIPATDKKYATLHERNLKLYDANQRLEETNRKLEEVYAILKAKNASLAEKLDSVLRENNEIENILGMTA